MSKDARFDIKTTLNQSEKSVKPQHLTIYNYTGNVSFATCFKILSAGTGKRCDARLFFSDSISKGIDAF